MEIVRTRRPMERNIALELVRVTESAAISAGRHMGQGDKNLVDQAAVDAMRFTLGSIPMDGIVVIGEGEKDEAPMLYIGERIGDGSSPQVDVAVDPIDGTTLAAKGLPGAISVIALSPRGTMHIPREIVYMNKIVVGPDARHAIDITASVTENLKNIAWALKRKVWELTVVVLDRPRHDALLAEIRATGARVRLISDGDVVAGISAALPDTGVDVAMGIGGSPEGVLTAAALRCIGGAIHAMPWARDDQQRARAEAAGIDFKTVYTTESLVSADDVFFAATGVTGGDLLNGVRYIDGHAVTQSLVMRAYSGTIRWIESVHNLERLDKVRFTD